MSRLTQGEYQPEYEVVEFGSRPSIYHLQADVAVATEDIDIIIIIISDYLHFISSIGVGFMSELIRREYQNEYEVVEFGTFWYEHWGQQGNESFDSMELKEEVVRGIYSSGLERPNLIQQKVIPPILQGRDTFLIAKPGTGKTTSILIGLLQKLNTNSDDNRKCQMIILTCTRNRTLEMMTRISEVGGFLNIKAHCLLGGIGVGNDVRICREGVQIIVGTPGRVFDILERGSLCVDHVCMLFFDGIDEMLRRGFADFIKSIFSRIPEARQTLFSSEEHSCESREVMAVMHDPLVLRLSDDYSNDVSLENCSYIIAEDVDGVEETDSEFEKKFKALLTCLRVIRSRNIIICNDVETVRILHERLEATGVKTIPVIDPIAAGNNRRFCDLCRTHSGEGIFILSDNGIYLFHKEHRYGFADIINFDLARTPVMMRYRNGSKGAFGRKYARITIVTRSEMPRLLELGTSLDMMIFQAPMDVGYYA